MYGFLCKIDDTLRISNTCIYTDKDVHMYFTLYIY